jgi:hypothetical protein
VLTAGTVLPTFFIIGVAFIPVGVILLLFSNGVSENIIIDELENQFELSHFYTLIDK